MDNCTAMQKRCIMIFPQFLNRQIIDDIRARFDPLAQHVQPHITLVFPFDSDLATAALEEHLTFILSGLEPFEVVLRGISPVDKYLFLNVRQGQDKIIELHKLLYTGILRQFFPEWLKSKAFRPHMTVGMLDSDTAAARAAAETMDINDSFTAMVECVSVEIIDENDDSLIELTIPLGRHSRQDH